MGLNDYHLPDMDQIAEVSHAFYDNNLRGGEGHMEVGKLIQNVAYAKVNMTLSVKPFGCMPSSSVSDGVQSLITELYPQGIFLPIETNGEIPDSDSRCTSSQSDDAHDEPVTPMESLTLVPAGERLELSIAPRPIPAVPLPVSPAGAASVHQLSHA